MAHLIAPPSAVQPMTKEDVAVVQAEKRVDAATREQLVKVYGDSRDPHGRPIDLTRPPHRNWKCSSCGKVSTDIRHVCGFCLHPEPGYTNSRLLAPQSGEAKPNARLTAAETGVSPEQVRRPGTTHDDGVRLLQLNTTKRTYRLYTEPHVPTAASHSKAVQRAARAEQDMAIEEGDEDNDDPVWDDEPDCNGDGQSCRPGGAAAAATPDAERRAPNEEKVDGGFTHFVSIPLGKLPAITANASRMLEDLRSFVGANAHVDGGEETAEDGLVDDGLSETASSSVATASTAGGGGGASASPVAKSVATPDLVTSTPKLHMTLLMLTLPNREDVEFAKELLQGPFAAAWAAVKEKAVMALKNKNHHASTSASNEQNNNNNSAGSSAPALLLSGDTSLAPAHRHPLLRLGGGLQVMRAGKDNELYHPQKASVVYMGIDEPAALATVQQLQRVLHDSFAELIQDFAEAKRSRRVLHVTVMNKKWRKARGARRPFDARPILEAFQEAVIGAGDDGEQLFEIPELELCSMRRHDAETGTYFAEAVVKI